MNEVYEYLKKTETFYLATVDNGRPKVRAMGLILRFNEKLHFCMGNNKKVYEQLLANPAFEICCYGGGDYWLRISGDAIQDKSQELYDYAFSEVPFLSKMYPDKTGVQPAFFAMENAEATFTTYDGKIRIIEIK